MDENKKLASSARHSIAKQKKQADEEILRERHRLATKMYWEDFRSTLKSNLKEKMFYGLGINITLSLMLRSVAIFPVGFGVYMTYESMNAWLKTPGINYYMKDED
jgi:hypothetical protein